jgi:DNA-binding transcriptional ArsR family regulator
MRVIARVPLRGAADVLAALRAHVDASVRDIARAAREGRPLPPLYEAGVRYDRRDPNERWQLPTETMARRRGDCEDLASWRVAELRASGERAHVGVRRTGPRVLHAVVVRGDGSVEDPSKRLGMR